VVGLSSIYQTLDGLVAENFLQAREEPNPGQGASYRTVYSLTEAGQLRLQQLARMALASTQHQRFDYDLGLGTALTCLPLSEVRQALQQRHQALHGQYVQAESACKWAEHMLGAWVVLDHQRRALEMELAWLESVIERLNQEEGLQA